jgi:hypothetical protein
MEDQACRSDCDSSLSGTAIPEPTGSFVSGAHGSVVKMVRDISVSDVLTQERRPLAALSRFELAAPPQLPSISLGDGHFLAFTAPSFAAEPDNTVGQAPPPAAPRFTWLHQ